MVGVSLSFLRFLKVLRLIAPTITLHLQTLNAFLNMNSLIRPEQAMAEMTYGELQILIGCTTFIKDQNFSSLFKGALKFKAGYQSFK